MISKGRTNVSITLNVDKAHHDRPGPTSALIRHPPQTLDAQAGVKAGAKDPPRYRDSFVNL